MAQCPFRFLHAADLHLEQPLHGIADIPEQLREVLLDAPYRAAQRMFDAALAGSIDFLVLSGDVVEPEQAGPRAPVFLVQQFERLHERGISVYWAGGKVDAPEVWPAAVRLPETVHVFPSGSPQDTTHFRDGVALARLSGASRVRGKPLRPADFLPDPAGLFSIAVAHGTAEAETLKARAIDYWALGGSHARGTLYGALRVAHYPGTPQGCAPEQVGAHGATLVEVNAQKQARLSPLSCDAVRWLLERVAVDEATTRQDLEARLHGRMQTLREANPAVSLMVSWIVAGNGPLVGQIRRTRLAVDLLEGLRSVHAGTTPLAWSVSLAAEAAGVLPSAWYEQDSILGDYLRLLREYQADPDRAIAMEPYLPPGGLEGDWSAAALRRDAVPRQRVLREAAALVPTY